MTLECSHCGGPAMAETVIKLRRGVLGVRATRSQGVYCATCKQGAPMERRIAVRSPSAADANWRQRVGGFLPSGFAAVRHDAPARAC